MNIIIIIRRFYMTADAILLNAALLFDGEASSSPRLALLINTSVGETGGDNSSPSSSLAVSKGVASHHCHS